MLSICHGWQARFSQLAGSILCALVLCVVPMKK
jgi:hypothetical protein